MDGVRFLDVVLAWVVTWYKEPVPCVMNVGRYSVGAALKILS